MESVLTANEKQSMVSSFLEIAVGQSTETARQFLQAASWKLEEAIQLFYVGIEADGLAPSSFSPSTDSVPPLPAESSGGREKRSEEHSELEKHVESGEEVRAPIPVKREILYDDVPLYRHPRMGYPSQGSNPIAFRNFDEELKRPGVWESDQNATSTTDSPRDNLATLYRPPLALMYHGTFEKAKMEAAINDKWLIVNLQSVKEFSSHILNRDTWGNEALAQTISTNFIFWQVYDDSSEGSKVCTYYNLASIPVVLVIDPITGQKMRSWNGVIQPESLLEDLLPFMDNGPKHHHVSLPHKRPRESSQTSTHKILVSTDEATEDEEDEDVLRALAASMGSLTDPVSSTTTTGNEEPKVEVAAEICESKSPIYPSLPEEPKGDRSLLCRVGIRLPDGRRLQRNFLRTDPIQLLWSFSCSKLKEAETRPFRLAQAIPGASNYLDYQNKLTFDESGLSNSMISLTWE
ncbi:UBX domain-containing protein isoform X2 [Tasmannia lanceolata]|uniref:UBX domain-containing protein isoform X2 n=1 Tax=Tasmannia lanceolata TaxID=3420 RepID=UPI0040641086